LLALITSRHTLDKQSSVVREYIAGKATLIAAVRLPNGTFRANAGTDVTTDLLFLQRRETADPEHASPI
jgi:adenine-specific DNA methylase